MSYAQWNPQANYLAGDIVYDGVSPYTAVVDNTAKQPSLNTPAVWILTNPPATPVVDSLNGLSNAVVLVAGNGVSVQPGVPAAQDISVANTGVLSVDGATGVLTTQAGQYYKNASQTLNSVGTPAFTTLTFQADSYQGTAITRNGASTTQFLVNTKGVYSLEAQIQLSGIGAGTFADPTVRITLNIQRGAQNNAVITNQFEITNATPNNPALDIGGSYALNVGDILTIQIVYYLNPAQSFSINGVSAAPNDYDFNTFWSWNLIKPLP